LLIPCVAGQLGMFARSSSLYSAHDFQWKPWIRHILNMVACCWTHRMHLIWNPPCCSEGIASRHWDKSDHPTSVIICDGVLGINADPLWLNDRKSQTERHPACRSPIS
jgi:hypothetical protein